MKKTGRWIGSVASGLALFVWLSQRAAAVEEAVQWMSESRIVALAGVANALTLIP